MSPVREALLDAAQEAALTGDWARTRMADVAKAAGVSRQTLYYEFGSKDGLGQALALREAERFITGAEAAYATAGSTPAAAVGAATEWTLTEALSNPLLKAALTDGDLLPFLTTHPEAIVAAARTHSEQHLLCTWPDLPRDDVRLVADVVTRLTISHVLSPGARPEEVARDVVRLVERLLPFKERT